MEITFVEKDQVWQDEKTNYWFDVDGEQYAVSDCNGELTLLDFEGYPILPCNDHDNIKEALIPEYERRIYE